MFGSNYVITGTRWVSNTANQACVVEIAPNGTVLQQRALGGAADDSGNDILCTPDNGFLLLGETKSYGTPDGLSDVRLVKRDADLNPEWDRTYDLGAKDAGNCIIPFGSNQWLLTVVSCTANCGGLWQQEYAGFLIVDFTGAVVKSVSFAEGQKNIFHKAASLPGEAAMIVGETSLEEFFPNTDTLVTKLNEHGDVLWTNLLNSYRRYDGAFNILIFPDETCLVC